MKARRPSRARGPAWSSARSARCTDPQGHHARHARDDLSPVAEPVEESGHHQCGRSLPGSRRPGKAHVQVRPGPESPNRCRARSTSRSEPISPTFFFTGTSPISSPSSAANASSTPATCRSPARVRVASGRSVSLCRRVRLRRAGFVTAAAGTAGRTGRVSNLRRMRTAGVMTSNSRRKPGSMAQARDRVRGDTA